MRKEIAKGKRERIVPLNKKAQNIINDLLAFNEENGYPLSKNDPLFGSKKRKRLSPRQVERIIKQLRDDSDIDVAMTPHRLRHSFATRVYSKTRNLRVVQTLLGRASIKTTEIYTHVRREELEKAVNLI